MAGRPTPPEKWQRVEEMIADGCPLAEIGRTLHMDPQRIAKRYPGSQTPPQQRGELSAFARRLAAIPNTLKG